MIRFGYRTVEFTSGGGDWGGRGPLLVFDGWVPAACGGLLVPYVQVSLRAQAPPTDVECYLQNPVSPILRKYLFASNAGIATSYSDWPGVDGVVPFVSGTNRPYQLHLRTQGLALVPSGVLVEWWMEPQLPSLDYLQRLVSARGDG